MEEKKEAEILEEKKDEKKSDKRNPFQKLKEGVESGDFKFIQLYLNYYVGKPKETKDITSNGNEIKSPFIIIGTESNKD